MAPSLTERRIEVVDDDVAEVLRGKTPAERVHMVFGAYRFMRQLILGVVRDRHPDWDTARVEAEVARRMSHGPE